MNEKINIRKVELKDIPSVAKIKVDGWKTAYKNFLDSDYLNELSIDNNIKKLEKNYDQNGFIVAEYVGEIVGFCRFIDDLTKKVDNDNSTISDDIDCELTALYVRPDLKGKGIGTKLFDYVVNEFRKQNKKRMILWCFDDNKPSRIFYEKKGGKLGDKKINIINNKNYYEISYIYEL